jgi:F420-dependent oxidoreductase-like protein
MRFGIVAIPTAHEAGGLFERAIGFAARVEALGFAGLWTTDAFARGSVTLDPLIFLSALCQTTERIELGTWIVHTFPRHPLVVVQQALVVAALAPGRLRLGVGPSHPSTMEGTFGLPFERPLEHLREYVTVLRAALQQGRVDFQGTRFRVRGQLPGPVNVPVLISALRPRSFRLAGEVSDGALPAACPLEYLRAWALPALTQGAALAGRPRPPLIAQCCVAVHEDVAAVRAAVRAHWGWTAAEPLYQEMYVLAGYPEAREGRLSDRMADAIAVAGDEETVARGLRAYLAAGMDEVVASAIPVGPDPRASLERTVALIGSL